MSEFDFHGAAKAARDQLGLVCGALAIRCGGILTPAGATGEPAAALEKVEAAEVVLAEAGAEADALLDALRAAYEALGFTAVLAREPDGLVYVNEAADAFAQAKALLTPSGPEGA